MLCFSKSSKFQIHFPCSCYMPYCSEDTERVVLVVLWEPWTSFCYGPTHRDYIQMDLVNFSLFILSYLIVSDFEPWGDSLWELTYLMPFTVSRTCVCLMANLVLLNSTLFLTVHFYAVHGYAATHMHITHVLCFSSILPPPYGHIMLLIYVMLALDSISRSDTNMYI